MKATDVIGWTHDGEAYCLEHQPKDAQPILPLDEQPIFASDEVPNYWVCNTCQTVIKPTFYALWEIHDGDTHEVACEKCAHEYVITKAKKDHPFGLNYIDGDVCVTEDVFGEHGESACGTKHACFNCETLLG